MSKTKDSITTEELEAAQLYEHGPEVHKHCVAGLQMGLKALDQAAALVVRNGGDPTELLKHRKPIEETLAAWGVKS